MRVLLCRACHAANLARKHDTPLPPRLIVLVERSHDVILIEGFAFHKALPKLSGAGRRRGRKAARVGHNLLLRLHGRKADVLRFLSNLGIPFTNTVAERDARMMKTRQKISGGFRSVTEAAQFWIIRSVLSTAGKQGWNMLRTLTENPGSLMAELRVT